MSEVRWTWNRYARPIPVAPRSSEAQRTYREREDRNPERTVLDAGLEGPRGHLSRYLFARPHAEGKRVLDGGCGHAYGALLLASLGAREVIAFDREPAAFAAARSLGDAPRCRFLGGDLAAIPLRDGSIDLVVALEVYEHLEQPEAFLSEARRVLAPGGRLLLSTPNRELVSPGWSVPPNRFHVRERNPGELRQELSRHFARVEVVGQAPGPRLMARRTQGRGLRRLAVAVERITGFDPRRLVSRSSAPPATPVESRPERAELADRIRAWIEEGTHAPGPELGGLYRYGRAEDGEELVALCEIA